MTESNRYSVSSSGNWVDTTRNELFKYSLIPDRCYSRRISTNISWKHFNNLPALLSRRVVVKTRGEKRGSNDWRQRWINEDFSFSVASKPWADIRATTDTDHNRFPGFLVGNSDTHRVLSALHNRQDPWKVTKCFFSKRFPKECAVQLASQEFISQVCFQIFSMQCNWLMQW